MRMSSRSLLCLGLNAPRLRNGGVLGPRGAWAAKQATPASEAGPTCAHEQHAEDQDQVGDPELSAESHTSAGSGGVGDSALRRLLDDERGLGMVLPSSPGSERADIHEVEKRRMEESREMKDWAGHLSRWVRTGLFGRSTGLKRFASSRRCAEGQTWDGATDVLWWKPCKRAGDSMMLG